ncbi:MAG TPA: vWA domain-containing protein [Gaiellales bacterium]
MIGILARPSLPLADAGRLRGAAGRTLALRWILALLAAALLLLALLAARTGRTTNAALLPAGSRSVVVLDLSASLSSDTFSREGATIGRLADSGGRMSLVVFSDLAYEAMPPGTPASELRPIARLFTLPRRASATGAAQTLPLNPWTNTFTSGTSISTGLGLAGEILRDQHATSGQIVLVSDLADDPNDLPRITQTLLQLRREHVTVHAIALDPAVGDAAFFQRLLGRLGKVSLAGLPTVGAQGSVPTNHAGAPRRLIALAGALLALLAANERFGARLPLPRRIGTAS